MGSFRVEYRRKSTTDVEIHDAVPEVTSVPPGLFASVLFHCVLLLSVVVPSCISPIRGSLAAEFADGLDAG